jgi:hypothetical protein
MALHRFVLLTRRFATTTDLDAQIRLATATFFALAAHAIYFYVSAAIRCSTADLWPTVFAASAWTVLFLTSESMEAY